MMTAMGFDEGQQLRRWSVRTTALCSGKTMNARSVQLSADALCDGIDEDWTAASMKPHSSRTECGRGIARIGTLTCVPYNQR